jgi:hypothetical protein
MEFQELAGSYRESEDPFWNGKYSERMYFQPFGGIQILGRVVLSKTNGSKRFVRFSYAVNTYASLGKFNSDPQSQTIVWRRA